MSDAHDLVIAKVFGLPYSDRHQQPHPGGAAAAAATEVRRDTTLRVNAIFGTDAAPKLQDLLEKEWIQPA